MKAVLSLCGKKVNIQVQTLSYVTWTRHWLIWKPRLSFVKILDSLISVFCSKRMKIKRRGIINYDDESRAYQ